MKWPGFTSVLAGWTGEAARYYVYRGSPLFREDRSRGERDAVSIVASIPGHGRRDDAANFASNSK